MNSMKTNDTDMQPPLLSSVRLIHVLFVSMLVVVLIPLVVISYQSVHCAHQAVMDLQEKALNEQLVSKERLIDNWLGERQKDLRGLQRNVCVNGCGCSVAAGGCKLFNVISSRANTYDALFLYDKEWQLIQKSESAGHGGEELLTAEERKRVELSDDMILTSAHSHGGDGLVVHAGCRLRKGDETAGYVFAVMNASYAASSILSERDAHYRVRILDDDGTVIYPAGHTVETLSLSPVLRKGTSVIQNYESSEDTAVVGVSKRLDNLGWMLLVEAPQDETMKWVAVLKDRNTKTSAVVLLIAVVVMLILARLINSPFSRLSKNAKRISEGNVDIRMSMRGMAEARELASSFNAMLGALESLRRQQVQQAVLAEMGQLTSSVVHEFRNPLSSIGMNVNALKRKVGDDPVHSELAEICMEQVDRMEHLLSELLKYGKPAQLNRTVCSVDELMAKVRQDAKGILGDERMELNISVDDGNAKLHPDIDKIRQVFGNLIENAAHACGQQGTISIRASSDSEHVTFTVQDSGHGISKNLIDEIFNPFVTGKSDGTGLGLANAKRYVEMNGGTITAGNAEEGGAVFVVRLPKYDGGTS